MKISAYEVWVKDKPEWATIINAASPGKAKSEYLMYIGDPWPDIRYTDLRVRETGPIYTSEKFKNNACYRGLPHVKCGQRVKVGEARGTIVGHNDSANFVVLFDEDSKYKGKKLSCHPNEITLI